LEDVVDELELDRTLHHKHALLSQPVHGLENQVFLLANGYGSSVNFPDEVVQSDEGP